MERLKLEDLARLVDEQPTPREQAALDADPALRRELEAMRSQTAAMRSMPAIPPPPDGWRALEEELATAGLIRGALPGRVIWAKWMQAAAALVLFIGGTAFGWITAGGGGLDVAGSGLDVAGLEGVAGAAGVAGAEDGAPGAISDGAATEGAVRLGTAAAMSDGRAAMPVSLEQARRAVEEAELEWRRAYRNHQEIFHALNGRQPRRDPVARLAGIEALVAAGEAAVQESPDDEFLNVLYVNTLMERQQTLDRISLGAWH